MTDTRTYAWCVTKKALTDIDIGEIDSAIDRLDEAQDLLEEVKR